MTVGNHYLAFHRLEIVSPDFAGYLDLSGNHDNEDVGMQPFDIDKKVFMVCNGEIYNFQDHDVDQPLRSDVDIVLHMLADVLTDPEEVVRRVALLDGDFAFVITDGTNVVAGRDTYGVRPLFITSDSLAIASEAKALIHLLPEDNIKVFPPGHVLVGGKLIPYEPRGSNLVRELGADLINVHERFRHFLEMAVDKRVMHGDCPKAVLCSGGVDSAIMTAIAARIFNYEDNNGLDHLPVFTMQYAKGRSDDAWYAKLMCERLGLTHEIVTFDADDVMAAIDPVVLALESCDPNTVRAAIPMYLLARHISEKTNVKVVLSGEGADELLGGYSYFRFAPTDEEAAAESDRLLGNLHMFDLLRADRCFAAFGLEVRVPFLDTDLVRHCVPASKRRPEGGVEKRLLREAFAQMTELADCRILDRPKEKFSDGTGFDYVPDLLRAIANQAGKDDGVLKTRLEAERECYEAAFERAYGKMRHLVVERRLPEWAEEERRKAGDDAVGLG